MDKRTITGTITIAVIFVVSFFLFDWFLTLRIWEGLSRWGAILAILAWSWVLSAGIGGRLISGKKAAVIATVCLLVVTPVAWWYFGGIPSGWGPSSSEETELEVGGDETENQPSEKQYEGTLFKYTASFRYLSSKDNGPITNVLFLVFPCPTIDNRPAVDIVGQGDTRLASENVTWQLRVHYENDGQKYIQIEMENGIPGQLVTPRKKAPTVFRPWLENTSHGLKIKYQFDMTSSENAFYHNEEAWFETKFLVPENKADRVTLVDNQDGVYAWNAGFIDENFKKVNGLFHAELSKWTGSKFNSLESYIGTEYTVIFTPDEWQEYRLDS